MHFVITGGAGFIGSHVAEQLLLEGHYVTVVDNLSTGKRHNLPAHPRLNVLLRDVLDCRPEDFHHPIDGIAHLAAIPSVTESWSHPQKAHHHNLSTTIAIIQLCLELNIPRIVLASSAAVYGNTIQLPISEEQLTIPISPYGLQKLASEQYIHLFAQRFGLSSISLRLFNVFGPRQVPQSSYSGVISNFIQAMQKDWPITIYGNGKQTRDFIYVKDTAIAFTKALTVSLPAGYCAACNIGTGQSISLLDLVDILRSCFTQWNAGINFLNSRAGDIQHSRADVSKARSLLCFTPQWSAQSGIEDLGKLSIPSLV